MTPLQPLCIDLFGGEQGAAEGYRRAGFRTVSVEIEEKRAKLCPLPVVVGDALVAGAAIIDKARRRGAPFVVHASPPCWKFTRGNAANDTSALPDLITPTREMLVASGAPYVIENVEDAAPWLDHPVMLCGSMFGLGATDTDGTRLWMRRHRLFESNVTLWPPATCHHPRTVQAAGAYGGARRDKTEARLIRKGGYVPASLDVLRTLIGAPWMTEAGCFLSVPPAYTEHLAGFLLDALAVAA